MSRLALQYLVAIAVAGVAFMVLYLVRGFFAGHALLVALAIAALVFTSWRTLDRWRLR